MKKYTFISQNNNRFWIEINSDKVFKLIGSIFEDEPKKEEININKDNLNFSIPFDKNKVIGLAYNYKSLVKKKSEFDEPLVFLKSNTGLIPHHGEIIYPNFVKKVWIEAELCIIIKKEGKNIDIDKAEEHILGYTCGNDVTAENIHKRDWHLGRSKGLDTFAPIGPYLFKELKTKDLQIRSFINDKKTQESRTSERILDDKECVSLVSKYFTLFPGDIIFTGTPAGATDAIVKKGDKVTIEIEKIGKLVNSIK
tara:strand:- start:3086 stop:3844 length:759 start_codon:yes stop_codon:yes gene_type:complete